MLLCGNCCISKAKRVEERVEIEKIESKKI
jgi:hypothetical protein